MAVEAQERPPVADSAIELLPDEPQSAAAARRPVRTALRGRERGGPVEAITAQLTDEVERTRAAVSTTLTSPPVTSPGIRERPGGRRATVPARRCTPRGMRERG
ncbi:hypothetical protein J2S46_007056 [Kitasatospora herbaricolor]|uniref:hypothetical protein n=1 Tax=Kitasatospora herbaricolor TaxID=68217 RepID=UPI001749B142|nr:hypothetical protein [Kitasatospora herbaricolor]MDQ0312500.1 hypothetical protein [Kitasatospora herbaricolor]